MSELHFVERQRNFNERGDEFSHWDIDDSSRWTLFERADIVLLSHATCSRFLLPDGKEARHWTSRTWLYFSMRSGSLRVYRSDRKRGQRGRGRMADITATIEYGPSFWGRGKALITAALVSSLVSLSERTTGYVPELDGPPDDGDDLAIAVTRIAYPLLRHGTFRKPVIGISRALKSSTAREAAEALVGRRRARRDIVRAMATASPERMAIARALRNDVPVDWLAEFLTPAPYLGTSRIDVAGIRALILSAPEHHRRNLLLTSPHWLADTIRMRKEVPLTVDIDTRSWRAVHNSLSVAHRRLAYVDIPIEQVPYYQALDGRIVAVGEREFTLRSPKGTGEIRSWGDTLRHCIGSYANMAVRHETYLAAVFEGQTLIANAEVEPKTGEVWQLYGNYNRTWILQSGAR